MKAHSSSPNRGSIPPTTSTPKSIDPEREAVSWSNKSFKNILDGNWDEALKNCERALALDKNNQQARYNETLAYLGLGRIDKAEASLLHLDGFSTARIKQHPLYAKSLVIQARQATPEKGIIIARNAVSLDEKGVEGWLLLIEFALDLEQKEEAIAAYFRAEAVVSSHTVDKRLASVFVEEANALIQADPKKAFSYCKIANGIQLGSASPSLLAKISLRIADQYLDENDWESAELAIDRALSFDPNVNVSGHFERLYLDKCRKAMLGLSFDDLLQLANKAIEIFPESIEALCYRTHALWQLGRIEEANETREQIAVRRRLDNDRKSIAEFGKRILSVLVKQNGKEILESHQSFSNALEVYFSSMFNKERNILSVSYAENIPTEIRNEEDQISLRLLTPRLERRVIDIGYTESIAKWAVDAWVIALHGN